MPESAYDIGWAGLSAEEQLIVELINRARMDPLQEAALQNEGLAAGVSSAPQDALAVVQSLSDASEAHSEDMDDRNFFDHTNLDGDSPFDRIRDAGISYGTAGENISAGYSTPAAAHTGWMDSSGHRANILNSNFTHIGVGYHEASRTWVQVFLRR